MMVSSEKESVVLDGRGVSVRYERFLHRQWDDKDLMTNLMLKILARLKFFTPQSCVR